MLPLALRSSYRQYKADTDMVTTWLATTSKACGYVDARANSNRPSKSGRLKGKARKQAVIETGSGDGLSSSQKETGKAKNIIAIKDIEPMAAHIAKASGVRVPDYFAISLNRVIWG